jgi:SAM-dependent methyltransferase
VTGAGSHRGYLREIKLNQPVNVPPPPTRTAIEQTFQARRGHNLEYLLRERFAFLSQHVLRGQTVLEIGAGQGMMRDFLTEVDLVQTDVHQAPWLDVSASGEALPFADASFDATIAIAALHHMNFPVTALGELARVTRPGGKVLVLESSNSRLLRLLLSLRGHEYVDDRVDPFSNESCQRSGDNWDGNNALGDLIFSDREKLKRVLPELEVVHHRFCECLLFVNSGGVNHRAPYVPLPRPLLNAMAWIDRGLCALAPRTFALVQEIVLRKTEGV